MYTFEETYNFFQVFEKLSFTIKNCHFSNTFWLYQHGDRSVYFQSYSSFKREILIWVTLYATADQIEDKNKNIFKINMNFNVCDEKDEFNCANGIW